MKSLFCHLFSLYSTYRFQPERRGRSEIKIFLPNADVCRIERDLGLTKGVEG
jgi:hypothetical protein